MTCTGWIRRPPPHWSSPIAGWVVTLACVFGTRPGLPGLAERDALLIEAVAGTMPAQAVARRLRAETAAIRSR